MSQRLFIGGLPWAVDDQKLRDHFEPFGQILSAEVIRDRETQRSRGFGFVEFDGTEMGTRAITVSLAKHPGG
jgi:RNA recognition motif-containing protein